MSNSNSPFENDYFFQNNSVPIIIFDKDQFIIAVNKATIKLFNYKREDFVNKKISDFTKKEDFEFEIDNIKSLISGKITNYTIVRKYLSKNKENLNLEIDIALVKTNNPAEFYFAGSISVIEQFNNQSNEKLQLNNLKVVLQKSPVIQWIKDEKNNKILFENNNLLNYLGYNESDYGNKKPKVFLLDKIIDKELYLENNTKNEYSFEFRVLSKDDTVYWFVKKCIPLKIDGENNSLQSYGMYLDISIQKKNELKIIKQEAFLKKISNSIPKLIYVLNYQNMKLEFSNSRCKQVLGYTDKEFDEIKKNKIFHPDFYNALKMFIKNVRDKKYNGHSSIDLKLKHKTKGYRWFRLESEVFERDEDNNMIKSLETITDINSIKENEIKIFNQQKLIKKVTSLMPALSYLIDLRTFKSIYDNNKSYKLFGYKPAQFFELSREEAIHKDFIELHKSFYKKIENSRSRKNYEIDLLIKHNTKGYRWFKHRVTIFERDSENIPIKLLKSMEDIHEQKLNRDRIKEQKLFIETISAKMPFNVYLSDLTTGNIVYSNVKNINILGYTDEEYQKNIAEIIHPNDIQKVIDFANETRKNKLKSNFELEYLLKHKTKGYRWYRTKSTVFKKNKKNETTQFIEIIEDIHEEKIKTLKINDQHNLLDSITNSITHYLYVLDVIENKIVFTNFENRKILGYSKEEYHNKKCDLVYPDHKIELDLLFAKLEIKENKKQRDRVELEFKIIHKTEGYKWVKLKVIVLKRTENGNVLEILEILEDIDSIKKKNNKLIDQENFIYGVTTNIPSTISIVDLKNHKLLYSNTVDINVLGYTDLEWVQKNRELVSTQFYDKSNKNLKKFVISKNIETLEEEVLIKHKTKGYRWYKFKTKVFKRNLKNEPIQILEIIEDIDENKKTFLKVKEQQNFIEEVASIFPNLILITNLKNDEIIYSNFSDRKYLGYSENDWIKKGQSIIHPKHKKEYDNAIESLIKQNKKQTTNIELLLKNNKGIYEWITITTRIFKFDANGKPIQTMSTFTNINDSKLAFNKIFEQQTFIHHISDSIPQYLSVWNIDTNECFYTNFETKTIFGYSRDEYINFGSSIIHSDFSKIVSKLAVQIRNSNNKNQFDQELLLKHKTRGYIWVLLKVVIIERHKDGKAKQSLEIMEDINESKLAFNKINEQQNFIQKINSTIPSIIQVFNVKTKELIYSNFDNRIFIGYTKEEWENKRSSIIDKRHYKDFLKDFKLFNKESEIKALDREVLIKNKNNKWVWVQFKIKPFVFDEQGKPLQLMFIFSDINEKKQLNLKLENSQKELDKQVERLQTQLAKNIELERFASIASHDLKEPLRTIRNYAQILNASNRDNLDLEGKLLLDYIQDSTKRMTSLVQDILSFSKIDTTGGIFGLTDINDIITIVLEDLSELINKKKIDIKIVNELPVLNIDQNQIRQLFQNLISNAIKFSIGDSSEIVLDVVEKKSFYLFSIKDNGIGIPKAELKNIFGIFKKLHNKTEFEGQGIGLSICKRVIDRHDGEIWVESELGFGATFYFTLPKN